MARHDPSRPWRTSTRWIRAAATGTRSHGLRGAVITARVSVRSGTGLLRASRAGSRHAPALPSASSIAVGAFHVAARGQIAALFLEVIGYVASERLRGTPASARRRAPRCRSRARHCRRRARESSSSESGRAAWSSSLNVCATSTSPSISSCPTGSPPRASDIIVNGVPRSTASGSLRVDRAARQARAVGNCNRARAACRGTSSAEHPTVQAGQQLTRARACAGDVPVQQRSRGFSQDRQPCRSPIA